MERRGVELRRREPGFERSGPDPDPGDDWRLTQEDRPAVRSAARHARYDDDRRDRREYRRTDRRDGRRRMRRRRSLLGRLVVWGLVLGLWAVIAAGGVVGWYASHLPPIDSLEVPKRPPNVQILGSTGTPLANRGSMGGAAVALKSLPSYVPAAFVAIEDRRFYQHFGIDMVGLGRAVVRNVSSGHVEQGGSTLTQQLAKNLFLTQERNLERKVQEAVLALWLERKFSKQQILEMYLNRVYFGNGAYGVEAAAQRYFGVSARNLTLPQAAMLAGLVKAPSRLAPTRNLGLAQERSKLVIAAMQDMGAISARDAKAATDSPATVSTAAGNAAVNYVADWVMDQLDDFVGPLEQDVVVETTIDPQLETAAETALTMALNLKGAKLNVSQGALVAMEPGGAIRALVGGRSYQQSQFNRVVAAHRQPGSTFKPFVYLSALEERGLTPDSVRDDAPVSLAGWNPGDFTREYRGPVTLTTALSLSLNTVAVRLCAEVGPKSVVATAQRLGIASPLQPNPSIALGTSEVTPLEITAAYAALANDGRAINPYVVSQVRTVAGKMLFQRTAPPQPPVVADDKVGMMNAMMSQTLISGTARKSALPGWQAAGKSGTSQNYRDAWFIGYTSHLVAGVWLGNDDGTSTRRITGGSLPAEIWNGFMRTAHKGIRPTPLPGADWRAAAQQAVAQTPVPLPPGDVPDDQPVAVAPVQADAPAPRQADLGDWIRHVLGQ